MRIVIISSTLIHVRIVIISSTLMKIDQNMPSSQKWRAACMLFYFLNSYTEHIYIIWMSRCCNIHSTSSLGCCTFWATALLLQIQGYRVTQRPWHWVTEWSLQTSSESSGLYHCSNTLDPILRRLSFEFIDEDDLSLRLAALFKVLRVQVVLW